jgi:hypothetical protein
MTALITYDPMLFKVEESVFAPQTAVLDTKLCNLQLARQFCMSKDTRGNCVYVEPVALWKALEQACYSGFDWLSGNHIKNQLKRGQLYTLTTHFGPCACQSELNHR